MYNKLCGLHCRVLAVTGYQSWKVSPVMGLSYGKMNCSHVRCIIDPEAKRVPTSTLVQEKNIKKGKKYFRSFSYLFYKKFT